jgi:hypothetical protein
MLPLDGEMAMLRLLAWLWTASWLRLARDAKGGSSRATDQLRDRGRRTCIFYMATSTFTPPSNPIAARNATRGVVLACVGPPEGGRTRPRWRLAYTSSNSGWGRRNEIL